MCSCRVAMRNPAAGCPLGPLLSLPKPPLVSKAQLLLALPSQTPTNGSSSLLASDSFSFRIAVAQCLTRAAQGGKGSILAHSLQPLWLRRNTGEIGSGCGRYSGDWSLLHRSDIEEMNARLCWFLPFSLCTMVPLTIREHLLSL